MPRSAASTRNERSGPNERGTFAVVVQDVNILRFEQPYELMDDRPLLMRRKIDAAQPAFRRKQSDRMASHSVAFHAQRDEHNDADEPHRALLTKFVSRGVSASTFLESSAGIAPIFFASLSRPPRTSSNRTFRRNAHNF
jgi:hypothetical protein